MKTGLFFMPLHRPGGDPTLAIEADLRSIQLAEDLGYDEVWCGEHHTGGWETVPSPEMFLVAAAERTKRIRLGTGVITVPFHDPFVVAERMALLDHLSRGRAMLGVGPGLIPTDVKQFGMNSQITRERLREAVDILVGLLQGEEPVTYHGQHYQLDDAWLQLRPYQETFPIAITTSGPESSSTDLAAKHGLKMISGNFFGTSGADLGTHFDGLEKAGAGYGRPVSRDDWMVATYIYVAESREQALEDLRIGAEAYIKDYIFMYVPPVRDFFQEYPGQPDDEIGVDQITRKSFWIVGDPDQVTEGVQQLERDTGGMGSLVVIAGGFARQHRWENSMELFARYVMPNVHGTSRGMLRGFQRVKDNPITLGSI